MQHIKIISGFLVTLLGFQLILVPKIFASSPSDTGIAWWSEPLIVSPLKKSNTQGLAWMNFSDLFSGGSTYSVPLKFPAGARWGRPNLSLSYSSENHDGSSAYWYGWSLPISSVSRSTRFGTDKIYSTDEFLLNWQEFIRAWSGYQARFASDSSVLMSFSGGWVVYDGLGNKRYYGTLQDSRLFDDKNPAKVFSWFLDKEEYASGERVEYAYTRETGAVYPKSVKYAFADDDANLYEVRFNYIQKAKSVESYRTNFPVKTSKLLSEVSLWTEGQKGRAYKINYDDPQTVNSHLVSIIETSAADNLPPTKFSYGSGKFAHLLTEIYLPSGGEIDLGYSASSTLKNDFGTLANPKLPLVLMTLTSVRYKDAISGTDNTKKFSYEWGKLYNDEKDPFHRQYTGFQKAISIEPDGDRQVTYFHQGTVNDSTDTLSKKGRPYKTETYSASWVLVDLSMQTYTNIPLDNGRLLVKPDTALHFNLANSGSGYSSTAIRNEYDSDGNIIRSTDYGFVSANTDFAVFTDAGNDSLITEASYIKDSSRYISGIQNAKILKDGSGSMLAASRNFFDNLEYGQIGQKILPTRTEQQDILANRWIGTDISYDTFGRPMSQTDPLGRTTTYEYDKYGIFATKVRNPKGYESSSTYEYQFGAVKSSTDSNGRSKEISYDSFGRPIRETVIATDGKRVVSAEIAYEDFAHPRKVLAKAYSASGSRESLTFSDGFDRLIQARKSAFDTGKYWVSDTGYDSSGRVNFTSYPYESDGVNFSTGSTVFPGVSMKYDTLGRVIQSINAQGISKAEYLPDRQILTDRLGFKKMFVLDARENVVEIHELFATPNEIVTHYSYTPIGGIKTFQDANGNIRNLEYDGLGRVVKTEDLHTPTESDIPFETYTYDDAWNLLSSVDQLGNTTKFTYDELGRAITQRFTRPDNITDRAYDFFYDEGEGNKWFLTTESGSTYSRKYVYDAFWRKSSEIAWITVGSVSKEFTTTYRYADTGEPTGVSYPDGYSIDYGYRNSILESVSETGSGILARITGYSPSEKPITLVFGQGMSETRVFDPAYEYRLSEKKAITASGSVLQDLSYAYDKEDQITALTESAPTSANHKVRYSYDWIGRLIEAKYSDAGDTNILSEQYRYDAIGNMVSWPLGTSYTYANSSQQGNPHALISAGWYNFSYDREGNMTGKSEVSGSNNTFRYDAGNRLIGSRDGSGSLDFSYAYDSGNIRLFKRDYEENQLTLYPNDLFEVEYDKDSVGGDRILTTLTDHHIFFAGIRIAMRQGRKTELLGSTQTPVVPDSPTSSWSTGSSAGTSSGSNDIPGLSNTGSQTESGAINPPESSSGAQSDSGTINNPVTDSGASAPESSGSEAPPEVPVILPELPVIPPETPTESGATISGSVMNIPKILLGSEVAFSPIQTSSLIFHLTDHLGSATLDTDENGNILTIKDYLPYGAERISEKKSFYKNRYSFQNKEKDSESGLSYFENRYYIDATGRFTGRDPVFKELGRTKRANNLLSDPQQWNAYSYARNNPVRFTDPTGEMIEWRARPLNSIAGKLGADHSYLYISPDDKNYSYGGNKMGSSFTIGGYEDNGNLVVRLNDPDDTGSQKWSMMINPSKYGMTENELITKVLDAQKKYAGESIDYQLLWDNCHRMATTILNDAWAPMEDLKTFDPKGYNPGVWERLSNFPDETGRAKSGNWSLSSDWKKKNSLESPKSTNSISSAKNKAKKQQKSN